MQLQETREHVQLTDLPLEWEAITGPAKKLNNKLREYFAGN